MPFFSKVCIFINKFDFCLEKRKNGGIAKTEDQNQNGQKGKEEI